MRGKEQYKYAHLLINSMASYEMAVESCKKAATTAASVATTAVLLRGVVNELVPHEVRDFIFSGIHNLRTRTSSQHTIVIEETEGHANNQIYQATRLYLATRIDTNMQRLRVSRVDERKSMLISMEKGEEMVDVYEGTEFKWQLVCREKTSGSTSISNGISRQMEVRSFELSFHKKHKEKALEFYLPFILARAKEIREDKPIKLHLNEGGSWHHIDLHHPSTFDTMAMDTEVKRTVTDDLSRFVNRKDYYRRIGKAWKRGYLLYGPPGTGKSSLIAAMANYLKFDVYDLELTEVGCNRTLRQLLTRMSNKSILVIEDIDCTINHVRFEQVTLSGLLNIVDGLWSTSGEEQIIVFTTNYKERLDPALLRPGRMDMHIHMSYCGVDAFRLLASNYHTINDHELFPEIEGLITEVEVTPAVVAEELMKSDDTDAALQGRLDVCRWHGLLSPLRAFQTELLTENLLLIICYKTAFHLPNLYPLKNISDKACRKAVFYCTEENILCIKQTELVEASINLCHQNLRHVPHADRTRPLAQGYPQTCGRQDSLHTGETQFPFHRPLG